MILKKITKYIPGEKLSLGDGLELIIEQGILTEGATSSFDVVLLL